MCLPAWPPQGATFACINAAVTDEPPVGAKKDGKEGEGAGADEGSEQGAGAPAAPKLATFAFRVKTGELLDQFMAAVNAYKAGSKKQQGEQQQEAGEGVAAEDAP
jgi:hypothetical protein